MLLDNIQSVLSVSYVQLIKLYSWHAWVGTFNIPTRSNTKLLNSVHIRDDLNDLLICEQIYLISIYTLLQFDLSYTIPTCSDNGAWTKEKCDGGSNGLLKGQKGETWEGGLRLVFLSCTCNAN